MLRYMPPESRGSFIKDTVNVLPRRLLLYVAIQEACHRGQLARTIKRWFPEQKSPVDHDDVNQLIDWFRDRGDLSLGPRGIVRCLPPHGVSTDSSQAESEAQVVLFGNPLVEDQIRSVIEGLGGRLVKKTVYRADCDMPCGLDRFISFPGLVGEEVTARLETIGLRVFSARRLAQDLPDVTGLQEPYIGGCHPHESHGVWYQYDALMAVGYQAGRWRGIDGDWNASGPLVKNESEDGITRRKTNRYFLHAGGGLVREISWEEALLWQYALDAAHGRSIPWLYRRSLERLYVGGPIPRVHSQLIRVLCGSPERQNYTLHFHLDPDRLSSVQFIAAKLGTAVREG